MAEVNTSIYQIAPQNPLDNVSKVYGIVNADQQLNLARQAQQIRDFELKEKKNNAVTAITGPMLTIPNLDAKGAQAIMLPQLRALGIDPYSHPATAPIFNGEVSTPQQMDAWKKGNAAKLLSTGAFAPVQGAAGPQGEPTSTLPGIRATQGTAKIGLGPAATAAATTYGTQAGGAMGTQAVNEVDYRRQVTPLEQAIPALERLGPTGTGPTTEQINHMKSVAVSLGFAPKSWTGSVKDFDEANKYLMDWVRSNGDTSTNDKLAASFSSNASTKISNAAAQDVAKTALAIRRMKYMQLQDFYKKQELDPALTADKFPLFASKWNAQHDPRAFGWDHYSVKQRNEILKTLPQNKRDLFRQDVQSADDAGVLSRQP